MARTVVALYDRFEDANDAVRDLVKRDFPREDISLVMNDTEDRYSPYLRGDQGSEAAGEYADTTNASEGAGVGAGIGAVVGGLGGLLVGLGALTIPGVGPVLAAGPLAAALSGLAGAGVGAVAGGVTGGLLGALVDMGIPEETAHYYAEGVRRGGALVTVRTADTTADQVVEVLNDHNPVDINQRAEKWRNAGWTRFDPQSEPMEMQRTPATRAERVDLASDTSEYYDFDYYEAAFRRHYDTSYAASGYTYDQYLPAYHYGYDLATDERYENYDWRELEPEAHRYWDERNPGTWDQFKNAVRHAWQEAKNAQD